MSFVRTSADAWQRDIPGARWFRADLHVHTIDDHPGGRADLPAELSGGDPAAPDVLARYAALFLRGAFANGVQVIGLTPHSPRTGSIPGTSAVWSIVEEWNRGVDVANDSRMRVGFERNDDGEMRPSGDAPDVTLSKRPWLRSVDIRGTASFFGTQGNAGSHFRLSPDVTCIIGGSMTGKSTLLDGLRVHVDAPLPNDETIRGQVQARGRDVFGAGAPVVEVDCPGSDPTAPLRERWPAQFFAQNELQRLSVEASAVEDILAGLVPSETPGIEERRRELQALDKQLRDMAKRLCGLDESLSEAEQAHVRARNAGNALTAFSEAGVEGLHQASRDRQRWTETKRVAERIRAGIHRIALTVNSMDVPGSAHAGTAGASVPESETPDDGNPERRWNRIGEQIRRLEQELDHWLVDADRMVTTLERCQDELRIAVERALAERGLDAGKLREIQELNRQASLLPSHEANLGRTRQDLHDAEKRFVRTLEGRRSLVGEQRKAFDRVAAEVEREFGGRIRARRADHGDFRPLDTFLRSLKQKGVTRWWNDLDAHQKPSPDKLIDGLGPDSGHESMEESLEWVLASQERPDPLLDDSLEGMGMSDAVQSTFRESMTRARRRDLAALRCPDRYFLELRMDDGSYRRLGELSGGQRVSVLLSLLLETEDTRPLVIDQPEDELDNRFLFETVLPALKRLKGRRQVIVATHDANIVVNGDADMVIQLEATASRGRVACAGAIEEPAVRDAILRTVDGGEEAFRLRRRKYGF